MRNVAMKKTLPFEREKHLYRRDDFEEICKDAMRFFSGTPAVDFPPPNTFKGAGLYALYYIGTSGLYQRFGLEINRVEYAVPIYIGKAEPSGWRQSRDLSVDADGSKLYQRLVQHSRTIASAKNLKVSDFVCRLMIFDGPIKGMIASVEAALIARYRPLWNSIIDGFGNHNPGAGRVKGKVSQWDALHPGREWVKNIEGEIPDAKSVARRVKDYMAGLGRQ